MDAVHAAVCVHSHLMSIPNEQSRDSIIAATALEIGAKLVTRNVDDFKHIAGLEIADPFDKS